MDEQAFRPQWQFKFQAHFDKWFGLPQCLKTYHLSLYNIKKDMLLTGPFTMLSMPSFDFHLPPCTEGFLIHLSPLWQLPLWQLPLFPSVAQFPCVSERKTWIQNWYLVRTANSISRSTLPIRFKWFIKSCTFSLTPLTLIYLTCEFHSFWNNEKNHFFAINLMSINFWIKLRHSSFQWHMTCLDSQLF